MRIILAALAVLFVTTGAEAYCVTVPDNAQSSYVRNGVKHTVCLAGELAQTTEQFNQQVQIQTTLDSLQRQLNQQQFLASQQPFVTQVPALDPSWP